MNYKQILEQYQEDLKTSQGAFSEFKKKMGYARKAFLNEIPDDIRESASNEIYLNGYITDEPIRDSELRHTNQSNSVASYLFKDVTTYSQSHHKEDDRQHDSYSASMNGMPTEKTMLRKQSFRESLLSSTRK